MPGFVRFFAGSVPPLETILQIEGSFIVDIPPAGSVEGVSTGRVAVVAEFADMALAVKMDSGGLFSSKPQPTQVFGGQDVLDRVGGFDELLGDFGKSMGNGFVTLRNKRFSELVVLPVNLCSVRGVRVYRDLPTSKSASDPNPILQVVGATVVAGREFKSGNNRARLGTKVNFSNGGAITKGTTGSVTNGAAAATLPITVAGETFLTKGVKKGDGLVLGVIGAGGATGANAGTYRIVSVDSETQVTFEKPSGANFSLTTDAATVYRIHPAAAWDSGLNTRKTEDVGYPTPVRNLDNALAASTVLSPSLVPSAGTATTWDSLSGLTALVTQNAAGILAPTAAQAPNTASNSAIEALYDTAFDALLSDVIPTNDIDIVLAGRSSDVIRLKMRAHVLEATRRGLPRMGYVSPPLDTVLTVATAIQDASPGVGAYRSERVVYDWPGLQTTIPEAAGFSIVTADGGTTSDGLLDVFSAAWAASIASNLAPERSIAQGAEPVPSIMAPVSALQRGAPVMGIEEYTALKAAGICAPRYDSRLAVFLFQSAVTTSLVSGQQDINRRRFADFVELSLARAYLDFVNLPMNDAWRDSIVSETVGFYSDLKSEENPGAARIDDFAVDPDGGNTADREAAGVFVVLSQVKMTPIAKAIGVQAEVGPTVKIQTTI